MSHEAIPFLPTWMQWQWGPNLFSLPTFLIGQEKGHAVHSGQLPSRPFLLSFSFFLSFLLTDTNSLSHFLDFESHLMWANSTGGCSFICFFFVFCFGFKGTTYKWTFFFRLSTAFQCLRGQTLKVVYWRSFAPLL